MRTPKVGLLPLYLALYDTSIPGLRDRFGPLFTALREGFAAGGIAMAEAPICCVEDEVMGAVAEFERQDVDLIVSVHLAYSPSLESAGVLTKTRIPLLLLDTTMDHAFGPDVDPARILVDHGIHGVQDLASVLNRNGKAYDIVAGHMTESDAIERASGFARAAFAARKFRDMKILRVGPTFRGMGDFAVPDASLWERFGIQTDTVPADALAEWVGRVTEDEVDRELSIDRAEFEVLASEEVHRRSLRVCLALRHLLDDGGYGAFSMNFQAFDRAEGPVNTVPFLEACRAMQRGLGYAGEGDVLTAALVGALSASFGGTTFTEIFCPDWKGGSLFLSHMGEINPATAAGRPRLIEMDFPYAAALNPAIVACDMGPGPATLVNLAPGPDDTYTLIAAPMEMFGQAQHPGMLKSIRGWARPAIPLEDFLEAFSQLGGTHHSALVYGEHEEAIEALANYLRIDSVVIA
jgi:L-arabinose isomerase